MNVDLPHADDDGLRRDEHLPAGPDPLTDAVIAEIRQGHQILATELARLNAALAASRRPPELDATTDLSGAIVPAYASSAATWDGQNSARPQRSGNRQPDPQRVVHLGSERTPRPVERRSAIVAGATAGGVGAVVVVVLAVLVLGPRLANQGADAEAAIAGGLAPSASEPASAEQVPEAAEAMAPATTPAIDAVLARAAAEVGTLDATTQSLVNRLAGVRDMQGSSRSEEAADVFGIAVGTARDAPAGVAADMVEALEPEVTMEAAVALATRRPEAVGSGMAPLLDNLSGMASVPAELQQAEAQALLDQVIAGVEAGTISGPYCNVVAHVLAPYLPSA